MREGIAKLALFSGVPSMVSYLKAKLVDEGAESDSGAIEIVRVWDFFFSRVRQGGIRPIGGSGEGVNRTEVIPVLLLGVPKGQFLGRDLISEILGIEGRQVADLLGNGLGRLELLEEFRGPEGL